MKATSMSSEVCARLTSSVCKSKLLPAFIRVHQGQAVARCPNSLLVTAAYSRPSSEASTAVPRVCTLMNFADDSVPFTVIQSDAAEGDAAACEPGSAFGATDAPFTSSLLRTVDATLQVVNFETLCGRLAMIGFAAALTTEFVTGNSLFTGIDSAQLARFLALCGFVTGSGVLFAFAWGSKGQLSSTIASSCRDAIDTAVDKIIDGVMFDEEVQKAPFGRRT